MSSKEHLEIFDLDELVEPIAKVKLNGHELTVMPITGAAYDLASKIQEREVSPKEQLARMRQIVKELIPTIDAHDLARLSFKQIAHVIKIASGAVKKVERRIEGEERKNGGRPARRTRSAR